MNKIKLGFATLFSLCVKFYAQELPTIIPPSSNAVSLVQYVNEPVNNYTGVLSKSILLYSVKSGEIDLPISLSYYPLSIKIAQEASWVHH